MAQSGRRLPPRRAGPQHAARGAAVCGAAGNRACAPAHLRTDILSGGIAVGRTRRFRIHDPKPRTIHAPCFRERVLHHALMAHVGPVLEGALVADTFACRTGKGALAAVQRAQHHGRRWPWWAKIDIRAYFASIDHGILQDLLARRFKNQQLLALLGRIIEAHQDALFAVPPAVGGRLCGGLDQCADPPGRLCRRACDHAAYGCRGVAARATASGTACRGAERAVSSPCGWGVATGANRVVRGGSWNNHARNCRCAYRNRNAPDNRNNNLGFRCARAHDRTGRSGPEQTALPGAACSASKRKAPGVPVVRTSGAANPRRAAVSYPASSVH